MTIDLAKLRAETLALIDGTTPGPWVYTGKPTPGRFWIEPAAGYLPPSHYLSVSGACGENNARLIAAAPTLAADNLRLLDEIERLRGALEWYGEQARLCRLAHSGGDAGRHALQADGGVRARAALAEGGPDDR